MQNNHQKSVKAVWANFWEFLFGAEEFTSSHIHTHKHTVAHTHAHCHTGTKWIWRLRSLGRSQIHDWPMSKSSTSISKLEWLLCLTSQTEIEEYWAMWITLMMGLWTQRCYADPWLNRSIKTKCKQDAGRGTSCGKGPHPATTPPPSTYTCRHPIKNSFESRKKSTAMWSGEGYSHLLDSFHKPF